MVQPLSYVYYTAIFGKPGGWQAGYHTGTDYRAAVGTTLRATKKGKVLHAGYGGWGSAYGRHVIIQSWHNGYRIRHLYAHMNSDIVYPGQKVATNQVIGTTGSTGNVTGPHLHYEERVSPFGYYNHRRPVLPYWKPPTRRVTVSLRKVRPGKRNRHIRRVQRRLNNRLNGSDIPVTGYFGKLTRAAYKRWQETLGYRGSAADGIPGRESLKKLGFRVIR